MGYVFAIIMYLRKRDSMLLLQQLFDRSKIVCPFWRCCHSYANVTYHPALKFWDLPFHVEETESRNSKEKATITRIEYPILWLKYKFTFLKQLLTFSVIISWFWNEFQKSKRICFCLDSAGPAFFQETWYLRASVWSSFKGTIKFKKM